jgi:beta-galactosidase
VVGLKGTPFETDWNVWIYPARLPEAVPTDVLITTNLNAAAFAQLEDGGRVLWLATGLPRRHPRLTFEPIFWNRYMFRTQASQTLGLLCNPKHPALAKFPTDFFQDWQWDEIVTGAQAMVLDTLPRALRPIVQPIDDWNTNRKLGLVWACRVGKGRLLVCSADLTRDLDARPAARQLRASLLSYMAGDRFHPKVEVSQAELEQLIQRTETSNMVKLGAKVIEVDSEDSAHGNIAANAIDGDPETIWHTRWDLSSDPMPHHLVIDLGRTVTLKGITYLPRQNGQNGRIAECEIYCSNEPNSWSVPTAIARWPNTSLLQTVHFKNPVTARYLKLVALAEVNGNPYASIAELDVLMDAK